MNFKDEFERELTKNILPFWMTKMQDHDSGGFYGEIDGHDRLTVAALKGGILNARILWTFASAARMLQSDEYLTVARKANDYIVEKFFDAEYGGTFWALQADGRPADSKKQIYSQAFFIYALTEYHCATRDKRALERAIELYKLIERYSFDPINNGYYEAFSRDWSLLDDVRLSDKDANEKKTMNTHLHILEAYTHLARVWNDEKLRLQLRNLILLFLFKMIDSQTAHLNLFFDEVWSCKSTIYSYGHDIECAWLLYEAAETLGDQNLLVQVRDVSLRMAQAASEGLLPDGSLASETDYVAGHTNTYREWWPQAEGVVGFYHAYRLSGDAKWLDRSKKLWNYIREHLIDANNGEWYWGVFPDGSIDTEKPKAGFWKCPYHNGRMCMELFKASPVLR